MISSRYVLPVIFLLVLALVPTVLHNYLSPVYDDGKSVHTIAPVLSGFSSKPFLRHNDQWVKTLYDSQDWIERIYTNSNGEEVRLFAARSYNYKRLYHHPELALSHGLDLKENGIVMIPGTPDIPAQLLRSSNGYGSVAYVLLYEDKLVKDPVSHQFTEVLTQLISPRKVMTLFYVSDATSLADDEYYKSSSASILAAAIQSFMKSKSTYIEE